VAWCIFAIQQCLSSQATPAWLWISGNAWLRKIQRKHYSLDFFEGIQAAGSMQVWLLWWMLSGLTSVKEAVFCNTDLVYPLCCLHLTRYSLRRRRLIWGSGTATVLVPNARHQSGDYQRNSCRGELPWLGSTSGSSDYSSNCVNKGVMGTHKVSHYI
jgi:hypothetical protein